MKTPPVPFRVKLDSLQPATFSSVLNEPTKEILKAEDKFGGMILRRSELMSVLQQEWSSI